MDFVSSIRRRLSPFRRVYNEIRYRLLEIPYRFKSPMVGSADWLIKKEVVYGGRVSNVARKAVSPLDPRDQKQLAFWGMTGGDRMLHNAYAPIYAKYLNAFIDTHPLVVAEFGILKGTGLAIWCDLFNKGTILGFDIDISYFSSNKPELISRGAFRTNEPLAYHYDQLLDGGDYLSSILNNRTLDVIIDDGLHSLEAIVKTWRSVRMHLSERFVYFIEDFPSLLDSCQEEFAGFDCHEHGAITVISRGLK